MASLFISRWDVAVGDKVPAELHNQLGIAVASADLQGVPRAARLAALAARSPTPAPGRSGCSGPAPAPRIPRRRTSCTSRRSRRRSPSTRCPRRRCSPSPTTARSRQLLPADGGDCEATLGRFARGGRRRRRAGRPASEGRRGGVRQVLERAAGLHRGQERRSWPSVALQRDRADAQLHRSRTAPAADAAARLAGAAGALRADPRRAPAHSSSPTTRERGERFAAEGAGLYLDYSKNRVTDETLRLLLQLAEECGLRERIDAMFRGEKINVTEHRAVLHVALRAPRGAVDRRRRRERRARGARGARPDGRLRRARPQRRLDAATPASASATSSTSASAARTSGPVMAYEALRHYSRARPDVPLRLERRRHRLRRGDARPRPGRDAVHRLAPRPSPRWRR